eukprot:SM000106S13959  [mRNA]  locus=s106:196587:201195:+ [translate_table: standard]
MSADELREAAAPDPEDGCWDRWRAFLRQYEEWRTANCDHLAAEADVVDVEYYPGRRKTGERYSDDMLELPFIEPGQHYWGQVQGIHLYEGAFINIAAVHDGWVPIRDNDWYHLRHVVKLGMTVLVEVVARRDPYRYRFPIELRLVDPNIDQMIHRKFEYPPIFARPEDQDLDEVARETGRPYWPKLRPKEDPDVDVADTHPDISRVWMNDQAEQTLLDMEEEEEDRDARAGQVRTYLTNEEAEPEMNATFVTFIEEVEMSELDLDAARKERAALRRLEAEASATGEPFVPFPRRAELRIAELTRMQDERKRLEVEALLKDNMRRREAGLPLEEPGRYADKEFWGRNLYDPSEPRWRHDYWGDPEKFQEDQRREKEPRGSSLWQARATPDEAGAGSFASTAVEDDDFVLGAWHPWEDSPATAPASGDAAASEAMVELVAGKQQERPVEQVVSFATESDDGSELEAMQSGDSQQFDQGFEDVRSMFPLRGERDDTVDLEVSKQGSEAQDVIKEDGEEVLTDVMLESPVDLDDEEEES